MVRSLAAEVILEAIADQDIARFVAGKVRVVEKKRTTVGMVIHNHRKIAECAAAECKCDRLQLPRKDGHVKVRLNGVEEVPSFIWNSKNVTRGSNISTELLRACIMEGVKGWTKGKKLQVSLENIHCCFERNDGGRSVAMSTAEVRMYFRRFDGLVAVPIDRNPGAALVICPILYSRACLETFNLSGSFRIMQDSSTFVLTEMKKEYVHRGLDKIARWQTGGKIGQAYVLPKDKDLTRWRPISPCTSDPTRLAGARTGRAIRYMLFGIPGAEHFDLRSTDSLGEQTKKFQRDLSTKGDCVITRSYDIKDMFARLSHESVIESVEWLMDYHKQKGLKGVRVSTRGKMCSMIRKVRKEEGFISLSFDDLKREVSFELAHSFVRCAGEVMLQEFGIPMGRSSSPALACTVCARAEYGFLNRMKNTGAVIRGLRMIDDVAILIGCRTDRPDSMGRARRILDEFEQCYDKNIKLVRKDEGGNMLDFLGTRIFADIEPVRISVHPRTRNQESLLREGVLRVQSMQDYASFSRKAAKKAVLYATLVRMKRLSNSKEALKASIAALMIEVNLRGYPPEVSLGALARFARVSGGPWGVSLSTEYPGLRRYMGPRDL
ncbi:hypothetical protein CBR_g49042 [Chara braunii]|uniref:Reverse transcriptase domain-containing protein n=1 Tax=Chara braunii TaxID=69332 RepID=A0A388M4C4_CHABU|nr:hypothetical protein CBR_g49042 [Chara braunii]|eukprot:GBG89332.1 hypothetical protein CBR_g49042 [Chara braunii]